MASSSSSSSVLLCCFLLFVSSCVAKTSPRPILLVTKDAKTLQYVTQVSQRTPLVSVKLSLDLGGEFMWVNCESGFVSSSYTNPICDSRECRLLNTTSCITECFDPPSADCANNTCGSFPNNPFGNIGTSGSIVGDVFAIQVQSSDGKNVLPMVTVPSFYFVCGSDILDVGLADGVTGLAGLGRTGMSLPSQLSSYFNYDNKFALCLSSSTQSSGAVFFGDKPYTSASPSLTYTPLVINSITGGGFVGDASPQYFIGVKSIRINRKRVTGFNESLFSFNAEGEGGTIISTVNPYTVLETSIYTAVVAAFVKAMPKNVERVSNIAPFGECFNSKNIGSAPLGPVVPSIDLVLENKNVWRISGANSMVKVNSNVVCLGFVEARTDFSPTIPMIIGGHQIEDNLLQFDLSKSRLGFSSSLLGQSTSCAKLVSNDYRRESN